MRWSGTPVALGQHAHARGVRALRLRELVDVGLAQREAVAERERVAVVGEAALGVHAPRAPQLGQQVDEPRAAEPDRRRVADHLELDARRRPRSATRSIAPVQGGHPEADARRPRRPARRDRRPRAGARGCRGRPRCSCRCRRAPRAPSPSPSAGRQQARGGVGADVAAHERQAVDARPGEDRQPQPPRFERQAGRRGAALVERGLGRRAIGHDADRLHVEAEEEVAHRRVADHGQLVDRERVGGQAADRARQVAEERALQQPAPCARRRSGCAP